MKPSIVRLIIPVSIPSFSVLHTEKVPRLPESDPTTNTGSSANVIPFATFLTPLCTTGVDLLTHTTNLDLLTHTTKLDDH